MCWVSWLSSATRVRAGAPAATQSFRFHLLPALQVAVAFLHNCGLVNGDIKPDNLLLQHPPGAPAEVGHAMSRKRCPIVCRTAEKSGLL